eukprot:gb/GECG01010641.1/.p1 GENE.gb/GECG01010641.1/~~gb/GECG01010641.1/.p1  ORF type:complete len:2005 (+),score=308.28 gb/GECG01010641.1/:1-6015(+)
MDGQEQLSGTTPASRGSTETANGVHGQTEADIASTNKHRSLGPHSAERSGVVKEVQNPALTSFLQSWRASNGHPSTMASSESALPAQHPSHTSSTLSPDSSQASSRATGGSMHPIEQTTQKAREEMNMFLQELHRRGYQTPPKKLSGSMQRVDSPSSTPRTQAASVASRLQHSGGSPGTMHNGRTVGRNDVASQKQSLLRMVQEVRQRTESLMEKLSPASGGQAGQPRYESKNLAFFPQSAPSGNGYFSPQSSVQQRPPSNALQPSLFTSDGSSNRALIGPRSQNRDQTEGKHHFSPPAQVQERRTDEEKAPAKLVSPPRAEPVPKRPRNPAQGESTPLNKSGRTTVVNGASPRSGLDVQSRSSSSPGSSSNFVGQHSSLASTMAVTNPIGTALAKTTTETVSVSPQQDKVGESKSADKSALGDDNHNQGNERHSVGFSRAGTGSSTHDITGRSDSHSGETSLSPLKASKIEEVRVDSTRSLATTVFPGVGSTTLSSVDMPSFLYVVIHTNMSASGHGSSHSPQKVTRKLYSISEEELERVCAQHVIVTTGLPKHAFRMDAHLCAPNGHAPTNELLQYYSRQFQEISVYLSVTTKYDAHCTNGSRSEMNPLAEVKQHHQQLVGQTGETRSDFTTKQGKKRQKKKNNPFANIVDTNKDEETSRQSTVSGYGALDWQSQSVEVIAHAEVSTDKQDRDNGKHLDSDNELSPVQEEYESTIASSARSPASDSPLHCVRPSDRSDSPARLGGIQSEDSERNRSPPGPPPRPPATEGESGSTTTTVSGARGAESPKSSMATSSLSKSSSEDRVRRKKKSGSVRKLPPQPSTPPPSIVSNKSTDPQAASFSKVATFEEGRKVRGATERHDTVSGSFSHDELTVGQPTEVTQRTPEINAGETVDRVESYNLGSSNHEESARPRSRDDTPATSTEVTPSTNLSRASVLSETTTQESQPSKPSSVGEGLRKTEAKNDVHQEAAKLSEEMKASPAATVHESKAKSCAEETAASTPFVTTMSSAAPTETVSNEAVEKEGLISLSCSSAAGAISADNSSGTERTEERMVSERSEEVFNELSEPVDSNRVETVQVSSSNNTDPISLVESNSAVEQHLPTSESSVVGTTDSRISVDSKPSTNIRDEHETPHSASEAAGSFTEMETTGEDESQYPPPTSATLQFSTMPTSSATEPTTGEQTPTVEPASSASMSTAASASSSVGSEQSGIDSTTEATARKDELSEASVPLPSVSVNTKASPSSSASDEQAGASGRSNLLTKSETSTAEASQDQEADDSSIKLITSSRKDPPPPPATTSSAVDGKTPPPPPPPPPPPKASSQDGNRKQDASEHATDRLSIKENTKRRSDAYPSTGEKFQSEALSNSATNQKDTSAAEGSAGVPSTKSSPPPKRPSQPPKPAPPKGSSGSSSSQTSALSPARTTEATTTSSSESSTARSNPKMPPPKSPAKSPTLPQSPKRGEAVEEENPNRSPDAPPPPPKRFSESSSTKGPGSATSRSPKPPVPPPKAASQNSSPAPPKNIPPPPKPGSSSSSPAPPKAVSSGKSSPLSAVSKPGPPPPRVSSGTSTSQSTDSGASASETTTSASEGNPGPPSQKPSTAISDSSSASSSHRLPKPGPPPPSSQPAQESQAGSPRRIPKPGPPPPSSHPAQESHPTSSPRIPKPGPPPKTTASTSTGNVQSRENSPRRVPKPGPPPPTTTSKSSEQSSNSPSPIPKPGPPPPTSAAATSQSSQASSANSPRRPPKPGPPPATTSTGASQGSSAISPPVPRTSPAPPSSYPKTSNQSGATKPTPPPPVSPSSKNPPGSTDASNASSAGSSSRVTKPVPPPPGSSQASSNNSALGQRSTPARPRPPSSSSSTPPKVVPPAPNNRGESSTGMTSTEGGKSSTKPKPGPPPPKPPSSSASQARKASPPAPKLPPSSSGTKAATPPPKPPKPSSGSGTSPVPKSVPPPPKSQASESATTQNSESDAEGSSSKAPRNRRALERLRQRSTSKRYGENES